MTRFTKGHGTENDFVLVPDLEGSLELTPAQVQRIADRHAGIGADGVIRVVRTRSPPTTRRPRPGARGRVVHGLPQRRRLVAEMCGNGTRVFAAFLRREGLAYGRRFGIATRAGVKTVRFASPEGYRRRPWSVASGDEQALAATRFDVMVHPRTASPSRRSPSTSATRTPSSCCPRASPSSTSTSTWRPECTRSPAGTNVEFVRAGAPATSAMRVHERGWGRPGRAARALLRPRLRPASGPVRRT